MLLLRIALTTVWMIHLGAQLLQTGHAHDLDATGQTDCGVFRLGRDYVQRRRTLNWPVPVGFSLVRSA